MSNPPTYYRDLNTFRGSGILSWGLGVFYIFTILDRRRSLATSTAVENIKFGVALFVLEFGFYLFAVIVYRIYFHPLSKYPGPFVAKFTDWYQIWHCLRGENHISLHSLHLKYGNFVRVGPHRIVVNTSEGLRDIYQTRANNQNSQFWSVFKHFFKVPNVVTTIDRKEHEFRRRILAQAMTVSAVKDMEGSILKNIRIFCEKMLDDPKDRSSKWNSARNMTLWCGWLTLDLMGDVVFHRNWSMLTSEENRNMVDVLNDGVGGLNLVGYMPTIIKLHLDQILFRKAVKGVYQYQRISSDQSDWRIQQSSKITERDVFGTLHSARDPETGRGLSREEMTSESAVLIVAGSDTTSTTLSATIFYLLHNEDCFTRVKDEIRSKYQNAEDVVLGDQLQGCEYLFACVKESLRLSSPISGTIWREVILPGMTVDGQFLPPGTDISTSHYALHHNEKYFTDPFEFKPNRWLLASKFENGVTPEELHTANSAYAPFSIGRGGCLGKFLAYQEVMATISRLICLYDMRIKPGSTLGEGSEKLGEGRKRTTEFQTSDRFVSFHDGPMVEFRPRQ